MSVMIKKWVEDHKDVWGGTTGLSVFFTLPVQAPFVVRSTQWNECAKSEVA